MCHTAVVKQEWQPHTVPRPSHSKEENDALVSCFNCLSHVKWNKKVEEGAKKKKKKAELQKLECCVQICVCVCVFVCVCVCSRAHACVYVWACEWKREIEILQNQSLYKWESSPLRNNVTSADDFKYK